MKAIVAFILKSCINDILSGAIQAFSFNGNPHGSIKCSRAPVRPVPQGHVQRQKVVTLRKMWSTFLINHLRAVNAHGVLIIITPDLVIELVTRGQEPPPSGGTGGPPLSRAAPCLTHPRKQFGIGGAVLLLRPRVCALPPQTPHCHKHTHIHTHTDTPHAE